ncbi:MAG TPA: SAM-dependent methyltransferase [Candidatus Kryptonia bacterium]|nr:SAM-dependent methyltransferase [Candidatus Kryptonia bacterium]
MKPPSLAFAPLDDAPRIARLFPAFRDFVDDALFHPTWGYYSTGQVRFGEGGHYDTFPLALSPLFGRMLAQYAYRAWRRAGEPGIFEICELGAGNGQLCLDVLIACSDATRDARRRRFAAALRYRIVERSPALIDRQRQHLGPLAARVRWTEADLSRRATRTVRFGAHGIVFANEVLDCLAHHKIVPQPDGRVGVVFVVPLLTGRAPSRSVHVVPGLAARERAIPRSELHRVFHNERLRHCVQFTEIILPLATVAGLRPFLRRHCPEFFYPGRGYPPYFACPAIETLVRNTGRLYGACDVLWIDYGENRGFHLTTPERRRVFAGPPRSGASVYRAPGLDDITFMVDFSIVRAAAERAGLTVEFYGGQCELARRSGVRLDRAARELMLRYRTLAWMLSVTGIGPERAWRHTGLTWNQRGGAGGRLRDDVARGVAEFLGRRPTHFKLMILRRTAGDERRA